MQMQMQSLQNWKAPDTSMPLLMQIPTSMQPQPLTHSSSIAVRQMWVRS